MVVKVYVFGFLGHFLHFLQIAIVILYFTNHYGNKKSLLRKRAGENWPPTLMVKPFVVLLPERWPAMRSFHRHPRPIVASLSRDQHQGAKLSLRDLEETLKRA